MMLSENERKGLPINKKMHELHDFRVAEALSCNITINGKTGGLVFVIKKPNNSDGRYDIITFYTVCRASMPILMSFLSTTTLYVDHAVAPYSLRCFVFCSCKR